MPTGAEGQPNPERPGTGRPEPELVHEIGGVDRRTPVGVARSELLEGGEGAATRGEAPQRVGEAFDPH